MPAATPATPRRPEYGGDWAGIRKIDLETGEDDRVLDPETFRAPPPYADGWVDQLLGAMPDASGVVCTVGLQGCGKIEYFVYELSFREGLVRMIAELPGIYL